MPAKATTSRPISDAAASASGSRLAAKDRAVGNGGGDHPPRLLVAADHDERADQRRLDRKRRAQGTGWKAEAVAEAGLAVDHCEGEILDERRVLQPVVEQQDLGARFNRPPGARDAVRADPARRDPREEQRLIADRGGVVERQIDLNRLDAARSAIAARQEGDMAPVGDQHARQRDRGRRLAGPARDEIANADNRRAGSRAGLAHAARRDRPVKRPGRLKHAGERRRLPGGPEAGRPHCARAPTGSIGAKAFIERSTAPDRRSTVSPAARAMALSFAASAKSAIRASPSPLGRADLERAAGGVERCIGVSEIADHRAVQDGRGKPCRLDRVLTAPPAKDLPTNTTPASR